MKKMLFVLLSVCLLSVILCGCDTAFENNPTTSTTTATTTTEATTTSITTTTTTTETTTLSATTTTTQETTSTTKKTTKKSITTKSSKATTTTTEIKEPTLLTTTTASKVAVTVDHTPQAGKIVCYELHRYDFDRFVEAPSFELLNQIAQTVTEYSRAAAEGKILCRQLRPEREYEDTENAVRLLGTSYRMSVGELIDSAHPQKLQRYLNQNGITEELKSFAVIHSVGYPVVLWMQTENKSCFLVVDDLMLLEDLTMEYSYSFHTQDAFYKTYHSVDAQLIVNGKDITKGNYVKIHPHYAELPLVAILRELGATVNWKGQKTAEIILNKKTFVLDTEKRLLTEKLDGREIPHILVAPGRLGFSQDAVDEFILDDISVDTCLLYMNLDVTVTVDRDGKRIVVGK